MSKQKLSPKIIEWKPEIMKLSKIKLDPNNPNKMTDKQFEGLGKVIHDKGYGDPLKIDANNIMIDGEHRYKWMMNDKMEEAHVIRFPNVKTDVDRRIMRQVFNKLRGTHDYELDALDFKAIFEDSKLRTLAEYLDTPEDEFLKVIERSQANREIDKNMMEHYEDSFLFGNIKQIVLYYNNAEYEKLLPRMEKIMTANNIETHTDLFDFLITRYENNPS